MTDETTDGESQDTPPQKGRTINFAKLNPYQLLVEESPLGPLEAKSPSLRELKELAKRDAEEAFTPDVFVAALVQRVVRPVGREDGTLSEDEVGRLTALKDRLLPRLIQVMGFDREAVWDSSTNERGERVVRQVGDKPTLERDEGEADEEYLLRAWRDHNERTRTKLADTFKSLNLDRFNPPFAKSLVSQFVDNLSASQTLAERLADMRSPLERLGKSSVADVLGIDREPARFVEPPTIQNPMKRTNDLLHGVGADIAEMRELAIETAEMQRTLNDVTRSILTEFTIGAADSKAAADKTLRIAKYSMRIAAVSTVLAALAILVTFVTSGPSEDELQTVARFHDALGDQRRATEQEIQLLRDNRNAIRDLTARLPKPDPRQTTPNTRSPQSRADR